MLLQTWSHVNPALTELSTSQGTVVADAHLDSLSEWFLWQMTRDSYLQFCMCVCVCLPLHWQDRISWTPHARSGGFCHFSGTVRGSSVTRFHDNAFTDDATIKRGKQRGNMQRPNCTYKASWQNVLLRCISVIFCLVLLRSSWLYAFEAVGPLEAF